MTDVFEEPLLTFFPVELAGEWPAGAPLGTLATSLLRDGELHIDDADPRVVFSAELIDAIVDHPTERVFVDLTGCKDYMGALLKIRGVNRNVVYRFTGWYPKIRAFLGEFV